jgi:CheY-like chemotaxis protein
MPEENGYALVKRLRTEAADPTRHIPAIALTAYARTEDRIHAITAGFQTHLTKPINPPELLAVLAATAGRLGS